MEFPYKHILHFALITTILGIIFAAPFVFHFGLYKLGQISIVEVYPYESFMDIGIIFLTISVLLLFFYRFVILEKNKARALK